MPKEVLGKKSLHWEANRIITATGGTSGTGHTLLGAKFHSDTAIGSAPIRGAMIVAQQGTAGLRWYLLEHPYAAGRILLTDATDVSWAAANANVPVAPGARGHIIRANAGPLWESYAAATDGAVLIGDGTDIISDTTPTYTGAPTWNAGPLTLADAVDIVTGTTTGTEIGTAANQKIGFWGTTPIVQLPKASYNNWAAFTDVVNALVAVGLFDAA